MTKTKRYTPTDNNTLQYTKGTFLYLLLVPLFLSVIVALFQTNIKAFLLNGISFALFAIVLALAKKGFRQERDYHLNTFTGAPKIPYKMIAGYLLGIATLYTAYTIGNQDLIKASFLAIISTIGYYLFYGFDPKVDKFDNLGDISSTYVLETLHEAKEKLKQMQIKMKKIEDPALYKGIDSAISKANAIIKTIEEDPKDIRVARKFLIVYIDGISNVISSYTQMEEKEITQDSKEKLHHLLKDVEIRFNKEHQRLIKNNQFNLDVHIDVLHEQIKN